MKFYLTGQKLERIDDISTVANNSVDYSTAEFIIDNPKFKDKDINTINALFQNGDTETTYTVPISEDIVTIPADALTGDTLLVSLVALGDVKAYTTSQVKVKLEESGYDKTKTPSDPSASVYQQILTDMKGKQDKLTAGENITISEDNVISSTGGGATYTAGNNIQISPDNVISATNNKYSIIKDEVPATPNSIAEYHLVDITSGQPVNVGESIPIPNQSLTAGDYININEKVISVNPRTNEYRRNKNDLLLNGDFIDIINAYGLNYGRPTHYDGIYVRRIENGLIYFRDKELTEDVYLIGDVNEGAKIQFSSMPRNNIDTHNFILIINSSLAYKNANFTIEISKDNGVNYTTYNNFVRMSVGSSELETLYIKIKAPSGITLSYNSPIRFALVDNYLSDILSRSTKKLNEYVDVNNCLNLASSASATAFSAIKGYGDYVAIATSDTSWNDINEQLFYQIVDSYETYAPVLAPDSPVTIEAGNIYITYVCKKSTYYGNNKRMEKQLIEYHYNDNGEYKVDDYERNVLIDINNEVIATSKWRKINYTEIV